MYLIAIMYAVSFYSCSWGSKTESNPVGTIWENADVKKLFEETRKSLRLQITDSGTWKGRYMNYPDTLKEVIGSEKNLEILFNSIAKNKTRTQILKYIAEAEFHGLNKEYYHFSQLLLLNNRIESNAWDTVGKIPHDSLATFVILFGDAVIGLYHDLSTGRVNPDYTGSLDVLPRRNCKGLKKILISDSILSAVGNAFPTFAPYKQLQGEYERLLKMDGKLLGKQLSFNTPKKQGDSLSPFHIKALCRKLRMHGVLQVHDTVIEKKRFIDQQISQAVKIFKIRHGLDNSAVIDKMTLELLNITRDRMLLRLKVNLERWRWLGPVEERSKIWINIAENKVYGFQEDTLELEMKVCSGKNRDAKYYEKLAQSREDDDAVPPDNLETPLMKAWLRNIVANPTWHVPRNIMTKELLPEIKKNPGYLPNNNYKLLNWKGEEINPFSVDWTKITRENWKFRVEQGHGPKNALGEVVIQFPNMYSIFMHDTPAKSAFGREKRHVSHGCVRMESPLEMVKFITSFNELDNYDDILIALGKEPERDEKKIKKFRETMKDSVKAQKLKPVANSYFKTVKIPVYIVYFTAYQNASGGFVFTGDGYDRDEKMKEFMDNPRKKYSDPLTGNGQTQVFSP